MKSVMFILLIGLLALSSGCEETDVFSAQVCLNKADETNQTQVLACLNELGSASTKEALGVKCSILLTAGGITSTRMVAAIDSQGSSGTGTMMSNFSFNKYGAGNKQAAAEARVACEASGDRGLIGLSTFASLGTFACGGSDTCASPGFADCANGGGGSTCTTDDVKEIGQIAETMGSTYCSGDNAKLDQCVKLETAKAGLNPGDPNYYDQLGAALMTSLQ